MVYMMSHQQYKYERGLTAAEQRAADTQAGEIAAELRDLRLRLGRAFRLPHRGPAASAVTASAPVLSAVR